MFPCWYAVLSFAVGILGPHLLARSGLWLVTHWVSILWFLCTPALGNFFWSWGRSLPSHILDLISRHVRRSGNLRAVVGIPEPCCPRVLHHVHHPHHSRLLDLVRLGVTGNGDVGLAETSSLHASPLPHPVRMCLQARAHCHAILENAQSRRGLSTVVTTSTVRVLFPLLSLTAYPPSPTRTHMPRTVF